MSASASLAAPSFVRKLALGLLAVAACGPLAVAQVVLPPDLGVAGGGPRPSPTYDLALAALGEGRYAMALELATTEYRTASRTGTQRWIDSIAAAALTAECHYELGNLPAAVAASDEALLLFAVHSNWLLSVQFGATGPRPLDRPRGAPWGRSARAAPPARVPDALAIRLGTSDPQAVLQRGGVLSATSDRVIRPLEIMRGLVMALYRQGDLLGEIARDSSPLDNAARALSRRAAPPNHYSQSWIDVAWGTALWAQGKAEQARPLLERALVIDGRFDHPLAAWALIVSGRIALDADQPAEAAKLFEEATFTAAEFGDARALEEAFRWAFAAHMVAGTRGPPPSITRAADWAAQTGPGLAVLASRLRAWQVEALAAGRDVRGAEAAAAQIDSRLLRGEAGRGALGADAAYARAMLGYAMGNVAQADTDLVAAIDLFRPRSPRLLQLTRTVERVRTGAAELSDRRADEIFGRLLATATTRDVAADPLGVLTVLSTPRADAFQAWIGIAGRRGAEAALDATEAAARERWQSTQFIGGRRVGIERLLDAPAAALPAELAAQRAALVGSRPDLTAAVERMRQLRGALATALVAAAGRPDAAGRPAGAPADWTDFTDLAVLRGRHVAAIAAGREGVSLEFPPVLPTAEVRRRLVPRQLILSFHWTAGGLAGVLESRDRAATWQVRQAAGLAREVELLARGLGLFDASTAVGTDKLLAGDWSGSAARIERMLFENSPINLAEGIDELVIVPDSWLWYVPFELLPVSTAAAPGGPTRRLRDVCRVRYCPTRSLAVTGLDRRRGSGPVGIHAGRMNRSDKPATVSALVTDLVTTVERAVPLALSAGTPPPALVADTCEAVAIFEEIGADRPTATRTIVPAAAGQPGMTFGDWLAPPLKGTRLVVLPGLQSGMTSIDAKRSATRPGDEMFSVATDLIAAGAQAAVISRWRVGGRTANDLVAEFLRDATAPVPDDAPAPSAAESWHRAVDLVTAEWPDIDREPRLKQHPEAVIGPGSHPLLWSGYLLVECGSGAAPPPPPPPALRAAAAPALRQPAPPAPGAGPAAVAPAPAPAAPAPPAPAPPARGADGRVLPGNGRDP